MLQSPPSRRRGLKYGFLNDNEDYKGSPPSRRRGLKSCPSHQNSGESRHVASFTEAWIEIVPSPVILFKSMSPPSRRRGLKSRSCACKTGQTMSPPSRRRGLKWTSRKHIFSIRCRLLHGGVD